MSAHVRVFVVHALTWQYALCLCCSINMYTIATVAIVCYNGVGLSVFVILFTYVAGIAYHIVASCPGLPAFFNVAR